MEIRQVGDCLPRLRVPRRVSASNHPRSGWLYPQKPQRCASTVPAATRRSSREGFTFLELIVVVSILAVITAAVIPIYGASVTAMKQRGARGDFVALVYFVQELAVRESREIRLYIDDRERTYWLEGWLEGHGDDKIFAPLDDRTQGGLRHFPAPMEPDRIRARTDRARRLQYIAFYPNGACDRASLRLSSGERGEGGPTIATTGVLGGVEVSP